ncbi:MAG: hypothetical protein ABI741_10185 [Ferruginibacter sp.]
MKFQKSLLALFLFFGLFISCSKDDPAPASITYSIQGLWIGTYTSDQLPGAGAQYYS